MKNQTTLGILHPGAMGVTVAASAKNTGCDVYWVSEGRRAQSAERAAGAGLKDAGSLSGMVGTCEVIVSVCPPHAAEAVATEVAACGFQGLYVDANAIAPERTKAVGKRITDAGGRFVDGGIIGGPAKKPGTTRLYLPGPEAERAAACFAAGPLETCVIEGGVGKASAMKMCYAAYTKGRGALLCGVLGAAEALGVRESLEREWARKGSGFAEEAVNKARQVTAKAWRFSGEMEEISATFGSVGMPAEFHQAAAEIYRRLAAFKDAPERPSIEEVIAELRKG